MKLGENLQTFRESSNLDELIEKFRTKEGYLEKAFLSVLKKPFRKRTKKIWLQEIGDFLIIENPNIDPEEYFEEDYPKIIEKNKAKNKLVLDSSKNDSSSLEKMREDIFIIKKKNEEGKVIKKLVNIDKVAEYIEDKFNLRTIYGIKEETIEIYEKGIWRAQGRGIIKAEIERVLGVYARNYIVSEVLEKIKRRTEISREEAEEIPEFKRAVNNGVIDFEDPEDIKFIPHSKEFNFRTKWAMNFDKNAKCPKTLKFISETLRGKDIPKFQEWLGLHLSRYYPFKKFAIIYGEKNTGKSVLLNLLEIFLNHNVSGLSLQDIARGKSFDLLVLKDKDGNILDDLSSYDMSSTGGIKMSVGDGFISGEHKFGDKIKFRNSAKHTFSCNQIPTPKTDIDDEAYYNRILLFSLENVIDERKKDPKLLDKLTEPQELSGLLNWALKGYARLIKQNAFSNDKTPEETKFLMLKGGNSLAEFSSEVLIQADGEKVNKEKMYKVYCDWCMNHKPTLSPYSKEKLGRTLTKFAPYTQPSSDGRKRYWLNVSINGKYDTYDTIKKNMSNKWKRDNSSSKNISYNFLKSVISVRKKPLLDQFSDKELSEAGITKKTAERWLESYEEALKND